MLTAGRLPSSLSILIRLFQPLILNQVPLSFFGATTGSLHPLGPMFSASCQKPPNLHIHQAKRLIAALYEISLFIHCRAS